SSRPAVARGSLSALWPADGQPQAVSDHVSVHLPARGGVVANRDHHRLSALHAQDPPAAFAHQHDHGQLDFADLLVFPRYPVSAHVHPRPFQCHSQTHDQPLATERSPLRGPTQLHFFLSMLLTSGETTDYTHLT